MNNTDITRKNSESNGQLSRFNNTSDDYLTPSNLYREMTRWMRDWDNLLGEFIGPRWNWQPQDTALLNTRSNVTRFNPAMDIREGDNSYTITAELPGLDPKDVEISVQEGTLVISGEKKTEHENKGEGYHRMERSYGSFRRTIGLPKGVDIDHIDASFNNGVLNLTLPKLPEIKPQARKIEIKGTNQSQPQITEQKQQQDQKEPTGAGAGQK